MICLDFTKGKEGLFSNVDSVICLESKNTLVYNPKNPLNIRQFG